MIVFPYLETPCLAEMSFYCDCEACNPLDPSDPAFGWALFDGESLGAIYAKATAAGWTIMLDTTCSAPGHAPPKGKA